MPTPPSVAATRANEAGDASTRETGAKEPVAKNSDGAAQIVLPGLTGAVKRVDIEFELFVGADRQPGGTARHSYVSPDGQSYGVSIKETDTDGELGVRGKTWQADISGRVTRQGLSAVFYDVRGATPERLMALKAVPQLSDAAPEARKGRMPDGLLDRQSLLYQFMVQPPVVTGGKLWLSDGVTHELFSYRIAGFDSLPITALGGVRAIKIVLSSDESTETIELWLVPDMHYLPVRMRHVDRLGNITEQVAVSLDFTE